MNRPVKKAHAPAHAPKTYVEQLQDLQPHEARLSMEYYGNALLLNTVTVNSKQCIRSRQETIFK